MDKKPNNQEIKSQFFKTDKGKTRSNAIEIPSISLPKGGGAIKGIDEKFTVNAVNGTAALSLPLPFSPARGAAPAVSLVYNSGAGNGVFGLGWVLGLSSIRRKTDRKLPRYQDSIDSDTFLFSDAEDLVPEFRKEPDGSLSVDPNGNYIIREEDSADGLFTIRFYKPRIEGLFARIERWTGKTSPEMKWRVISRENRTTLFGWSSASRIADPDDEDRIFEWLPEFVFDDKGNCSHYLYKKEDDTGFDPMLLHNRNRFKNGKITYTNLYLEKILYGNKTPYKNFNDPFPSEASYFFQTVLDYGEYDENPPYGKTGSWNFRQDAFSQYKAGFEIRTSRLCRRVLLFHYFTELPGGFALGKSLDLTYDSTQAEGFSFLKSATLKGYIKQGDGSYTNKSYPAMEFDYQKLAWNSEVKSISGSDMEGFSEGTDDGQYQFTDMFNEGLAGMLSEQDRGWYYRHNLGGGQFAPAVPVAAKPSFAGLGRQLQLVDLDVDGGKQLVNYGSEPRGYFELDEDEEEWQAFRAFRNLPNIDFRDPNTRLLDINGDGRPDILITDDLLFTCYDSAGREGFGSAYTTAGSIDEEAGPKILFSDPLQTIFLADMSGDGMTDIVRIRNGEICYWPNLGYGRFGAKVAMDSAPVFDKPDAFNPAFIRLADIDGSGTSDIIYLGHDRFSCWLNLNGNTFADSLFEIEAFPEMHNRANVTVSDLLGNGVACIVSRSDLPKDMGAPLKYIDLMEGKKPHLMVSYKNNLGKEVYLEYKPSTYYYLQDKLSGNPWITKLHFPVHCVAGTETRDIISGSRFVNSYSYHHGYFDHPEREFRGFGRVEQLDSEYYDNWVKGGGSNVVSRELHQDPVLTKSWFHTGAFLSLDNILGQFGHEYWYEVMNRLGYGVVKHESDLPDAKITVAEGLPTILLDRLTGQEWQEALRACKGMALRTEVFSKDAPLTGASDEQIKKELTPHTVTSDNCIIELIQPRGQNQFAVFAVRTSETVTYNYERKTEDPRIAHNLNIRMDEYGNVLESAEVVYARLQPDLSLPAEIRQAQSQTVILYRQNSFTNDISSADEYRLRLLSEAKTYELKGVSKTGSYYNVDDFIGILAGSGEVAYRDLDAEPATGSSQKRLIEHVRTLYYKNDLTGPLPLNHMESKGLPFENYQLAYTRDLINDIFSGRVSGPLMAEGRFCHSEGDSNWWIRSGTMQYITGPETANDARNRFYSPVSYIDPFGAVSKVKYYSNYFLFIEETEDALGNKASVEQFDFRTLSPRRMKDANFNFSEALTDELGMVKATAVFGKGSEADDLSGLNEHTTPAEETLIGSFFSAADSSVLTARGKDLLQHASSRFVYDLDAYRLSGKPARAASIIREEHYQKNSQSPVQLSLEYYNGLGQVIMKKAQAEPGLAKQVTVNPDDSYTVSGVDTSAVNPKQLRWIGNGRTVINNKGKAVKQYEPYFSVSFGFENVKELVESGVTAVMYYDATGRLVRKEMPNGTFSKTEFDSWQQLFYDPDDTILDSSWYHNRSNHLIDAELTAAGKDPVKEKEAADQAATHAGTPIRQHLDTLGRPVLTIDHNKDPISLADEFYSTMVKLDCEGNLRSLTDARGNSAAVYKYDMLGNKVYQNSQDSGQRWLLINILSNPLRTWDERNHEFQYFYDILHRPSYSRVLGGDGDTPLDNIYDRVFYGESEPNPETKNLRTQVVKHYDSAGLTEMPEYNFKGQPVRTLRTLFKNYKAVANWTDANLAGDLESESYTFQCETDALGRITRETVPDGSIITRSFNEAGLLNSESVALSGPDLAATVIQSIDYNEKGQRDRIVYGNDVTSRLYYDRETFRLIRVQTTRKNGDLLQDLRYTFDPAGNITHIEDRAVPVSFFSNAKITAVSAYTYDALYRLVGASGRENNAALAFDGQDNWNDAPFMHAVNPGDPLAMRNYTQSYRYDAAGNILQMQHTAAGNNWTRSYNYEAASNRLISSQVGANTYTTPHHPRHGFITSLPHLPVMGWNLKEELVRTARQRRLDGGTPETTYYQYDSQGQRVRKITENQADAGVTPSKKDERLYLGGFEIYKKHSGPNAGLQRASLGLLDQDYRFAMIETRNDTDDGTAKRLFRYQLYNHLGSAALELDDQANVISYEEYQPFGGTAFQAKNTAIKSAAKRYRYTGRERDEESGLQYNTSRYYIPWLGRWLSADPAGMVDGPNLYRYGRNNPIRYNDPEGKQPPDDNPTIAYGLRLDTGGNLTLGPIVVPPVSDPGLILSTPANSPVFSSSVTCYGVHPTLGVYMPLGIGMECLAPGMSFTPPPPSSTGGGGTGEGSTGGGGEPAPAHHAEEERSFWSRGGSTLVGGGLALGVGLLIVISGPVGWVAALTGGMLLAGGIAATSVSAIQLGASYSGHTTAEQDRQTTEALDFTLSLSSPGGLLGATGAGIAGGSQEDVRNWAMYGGLIEGGASLTYGVGSMAYREYRFSQAYRGTTYAWDTATRSAIQEAYGIGDASLRARPNPLFYRGREYIDLSHFIPRRNIGGYEMIFNRPWNVVPMWATEHALIDPYRFQFMLRSFKSAYGAEQFYGVSRYLRLTPPWMLQSGYGVYRVGSGLSTAPSSSSTTTSGSSGGSSGGD